MDCARRSRSTTFPFRIRASREILRTEKKELPLLHCPVRAPQLREKKKTVWARKYLQAPETGPGWTSELNAEIEQDAKQKLIEKGRQHEHSRNQPGYYGAAAGAQRPVTCVNFNEQYVGKQRHVRQQQ